MNGNASQGGDLMFGRKTYEMMASFWPTPMAAESMPEVAKGMNAAHKHVASKTIQPTWNNTHLLEGDLVEAVTALKASPGPNITILGSGEIVAQLSKAGLIDQYMFVIVPVALGAGRTVFSDFSQLTLVESKVFPGGNVALTYRHPK